MTGTGTPISHSSIERIRLSFLGYALKNCFGAQQFRRRHDKSRRDPSEPCKKARRERPGLIC
jgi:hypothetical protein